MSNEDNSGDKLLDLLREVDMSSVYNLLPSIKDVNPADLINMIDVLKAFTSDAKSEQPKDYAGNNESTSNIEGEGVPAILNELDIPREIKISIEGPIHLTIANPPKKHVAKKRKTRRNKKR